MPFKSRAQQKWAFANHKSFAKKWAKMTNFKRLPARVRGVKRHAKRRKR